MFFCLKFSTLAAVGQRGTSTSILRLNTEQSMNIAGERDEHQEKDPILFLFYEKMLKRSNIYSNNNKCQFQATE